MTGSTAAIVAVSLCLRTYLLNRMRRLPAGRALPATLDDRLAPAELAYLVRDGDMTHTLLVLSVDLVQRAVKSRGQTDTLALKPYEREVWGSVKEFAKRWADEKVGEVIPIKQVKDPMAWLIRLNAIKTFVGGTLRNFIRDFIKDPLHIRKYFSWTGIARLAVQLYASTAREKVEVALKSQLTANYLLIDIARRKNFAAGIAGILLIGSIAFAVAVVVIAPEVQQSKLIAAAVMGLINAATIKFVLWAPSLIPSYDEFLRIAAEIARTDVRMQLVRTFLRFAKVISFVVVSLLSVLLVGIELAFDFNVLRLPAPAAFALVACMTLFGFLVMQLLLDIHALLTREYASARAVNLINDSHRRVETESPLASLQSVFLTPEYDAKLSEIVAIYGIETLWLLS